LKLNKTQQCSDDKRYKNIAVMFYFSLCNIWCTECR